MKKLREATLHNPVSIDTRCPWCNVRHNATSGLSEGQKDPRDRKVPKPGSLSICGDCGRVSVFEADYFLRRPTAEEARDIEASEGPAELARVIARSVRRGPESP